MSNPPPPETLELLGDHAGERHSAGADPYEHPHHPDEPQDNECRHCGATNHEPGRLDTYCEAARQEHQRVDALYEELGLDLKETS